MSESAVFQPEIDGWIEGCKVRSFPWIDGKRIYFNVRYFAPGQSLEKPPVWDRTVFIVNNADGRRAVKMFPATIVSRIASMKTGQFYAGAEVQFEFQSVFNPYGRDEP